MTSRYPMKRAIKTRAFDLHDIFKLNDSIILVLTRSCARKTNLGDTNSSENFRIFYSQKDYS